MAQANQQQGGVSALGDSSASRASGEQGGGGLDSARRQYQFNSQDRSQTSGRSNNGFANELLKHMEVIDDNGSYIGTIDQVEGDRIKLVRTDSRNAVDQYVLLSQVAVIEGNRVRLRERGDNDFGMEAGN